MSRRRLFLLLLRGPPVATEARPAAHAHGRCAPPLSNHFVSVYLRVSTLDRLRLSGLYPSNAGIHYSRYRSRAKQKVCRMATCLDDLEAEE